MCFTKRKTLFVESGGNLFSANIRSMLGRHALILLTGDRYSIQKLSQPFSNTGACVAAYVTGILTGPTATCATSTHHVNGCASLELLRPC